MKSIRTIVIVLVLLLAGGGGWWAYRTHYAGRSQAILATGTIEGTSVELCAKTPGTISKLTVKEGDRVTRGQEVAEIARNDLVAQREQNAIALLKAEAQLRDLTSGARDQELEQARANVNIAQASYGQSATNLAARETLYRQGAVAKDVLDQYRLAVELDQNKLDAAKAALSLLEDGSRPEVITASREEVDRSQAVLQASDAMLDDLKIISPIAGIVDTKNYEQGEFSPQGVSVVTVVDLSDLWIKVYIPTDELPAVKLGQIAHFTVSGTDRVFTGTVSEIASKGEFTPKEIQTREERANVVFGVKIRIDNQGGLLKQGMPADVTFD